MDDDETVIELAIQCGRLIKALEKQIPDSDITYCIGDRSEMFCGEELGELIAALVSARGALTNFEESGQEE